VLPGDRVDAVLAGERYASPELRAQTAERLGLDQPLLVQYGRYLNNLVHGDFGNSFVTDRPVSSVIRETAPASLRLAFWATIAETIVGLAVASFVMRRRSKRWRTMSTIVTVAMLSLPVFVLGYVLQLALGVFPAEHNWPQWARFPVQGIGPDTWFLGVIPTGEQWRSLVMPVVVLASVSTAIVIRLAINSITTVQAQPHVAGARARGLSERRVFTRHVLRNALLPVITFIGVDLVGLFGAAVVTETVFNWPGIGSEIATALGRQDVPIILGITVVLAIAYVLANLVVDLLYRVLDPRVRREEL